MNEDGGDVQDEPHDDGYTTAPDCEPSLGVLFSAWDENQRAWAESARSDCECPPGDPDRGADLAGGSESLLNP